MAGVPLSLSQPQPAESLSYSPPLTLSSLMHQCLQCLGIFALGETLPSSRPTFLLHVMSCAAITTGSLALGNGGWGLGGDLSLVEKALKSKRISGVLPARVKMTLSRYVSSAAKLPVYNPSTDSKSAN